MTAPPAPTPTGARAARYGRALAAALAAGALAVSLLAFWDSLHWTVGLLTPFRPQYALVAGTVAVAGVALRVRVWWTLAAVAALGINLTVLWPWLAGPPGPPPPGPTFRLMTWNAWANNPDPSRIVKGIVECGTDVAMICEMPLAWRQSGPPEISGYEVLVVNQYLVAVRDGGPVTIDEARIVRPPFACESRLWFDGLPLCLLSVHCSRPTSRVGRRRQDLRLERMGDWLHGDPTPAVVVGDFNATPWCAGLAGFLRREPLVDSSRGRGVWATFPSRPPLVGHAVGVAIDHCFFTHELACARRWVGDGYSSNHRPVFAELGWRER